MSGAGVQLVSEESSLEGRPTNYWKNKPEIKINGSKDSIIEPGFGNDE